MSNPLVVKIEGADGVILKFSRMSAASVGLVGKVVNTAALDTQREARQLCPVDTGRLRASIRPRFYKEGLAADVYTDVDYAPFVEFGTSRMGAQPFLFPAFEMVRPRYLAELAAALKTLERV